MCCPLFPADTCLTPRHPWRPCCDPRWPHCRDTSRASLYRTSSSCTPRCSSRQRWRMTRTSSGRQELCWLRSCLCLSRVPTWRCRRGWVSWARGPLWAAWSQEWQFSMKSWWIQCESYLCHYIDKLVQERRNSSALALELCLSSTNQTISIFSMKERWHFTIKTLP